MLSATRRIQKEIIDIKHSIHNEIPENISTGPINDNNIFEWEATIIGAVNTPYEGGLFKLKIKIPNNYPFIPPIVTFQTKVFHPNIHLDGSICLDILKYHWSPTYTIIQVLLSIISLLSDPNPDDPLNPDAAHMYKMNRQQYNNMVREYVNTYAQ
jgi:ubiquitin-conjugating enzyme E2 D